jgi:hypothetical protein
MFTDFVRGAPQVQGYAAYMADIERAANAIHERHVPKVLEKRDVADKPLHQQWRSQRKRGTRISRNIAINHDKSG